MKATLKQRLVALAAATVLNVALLVGLHSLASQHQADSSPQQLARASQPKG